MEKRLVFTTVLVVLLGLNLAVSSGYAFCYGAGSSVACSITDTTLAVFNTNPDANHGLSGLLVILTVWFVTGAAALTLAIIDFRKTRSRKSLGFWAMILLGISVLFVIATNP